MKSKRLHIGFAALVLLAHVGCTVNYGKNPNQSSQNSVGASPSGTTIPGMPYILDERLNKWTLESGTVYQNGTVDKSLTGVALLLYYNGLLSASDPNNNWRSWTGSVWATALQDPRISPNEAAGNLIVDAQLNTWTLNGSVIARNGTVAGDTPSATYLLYYEKNIYYETTIGFWNEWSNNTWKSVTADPRSPSVWNNWPIPAQTTSITVAYDATPSLNGMGNENATIGVSTVAATAYAELAATVSFQPDGTINVLNGATYQNDNAIVFVAGTTYHIEMEINITNHTFTVYVTPPSGPRTAIATNYAFRTGQASVASLANISYYDLSGGMKVSNIMYY